MELLSSPLRIQLLFCFAILASAEYNKKCGERYVERNGICCDPIFDCGPGSEIKPCTHDYQPEICQKCQNGTVQPDHITSKDDVQKLSCFKKQRYCTAKDLTYSRSTDSPFEPKGCKCNINACFTEEDNVCIRKDECKPGSELDPVTGVCRNCSSDKYKLHVGCSPCITNKTIWLRQFTEPSPPRNLPVPGMMFTQLIFHITTETKAHTNENDRTGRTNTLTTEEPNSAEVSSEKTTVSNMYIYIIIAVVIGCIIVLVAVFVFVKSIINMKRQNARNVTNNAEKGALLQNGTREMATNTGESLDITHSPSCSSADSGVTSCGIAIYLSGNNPSKVNFQRNNLDRPTKTAHRVEPVQSTVANIDTFSTNQGPSTRPMGTAMKIVGSCGASSDESLGTSSLSSSGGENEVVFHGGEPQENDERRHRTWEKYV